MKILLILFMSAVGRAQTVHHLLLGEQKSVPLSSRAVWVEDGKILKAQAHGDRLNLRGVSEGASIVKLGEIAHQFYVIHPKKKEAFNQLEVALKKSLGLNVQFLKGQTVVNGELFRWTDWQNLAQRISGTNAAYRFRATISEPIKTNIQKQFDLVFQKNSLQPQTISWGEFPTLRLPPKTSSFKSYQDLLSPYGIEVLEDVQAIAIQPSVRVQITVAEVEREWSQQIGIRWPDGFQAQLISDNVWTFSSVEVLAKFFESQGKGQVLASPNLICQSGHEAEFLAGGEFPIKTRTSRSHDVVWKKYGILLKVKPIADALGQIRLHIETEISNIDMARAVDGVPGLTTHRVSSQFDMRSSQTIALSGLIKNDEGEKSEGIPWLSRVPVLGALFSSKDFRDNRTELVIFVRPEIVDTSSATAKEKPRHIHEGK